MSEYYHFSNICYEINKVYQSKINNPYFGDYEKLFEKYKPIDSFSRSNSFFLVKKKDLNFGENFGSLKYLVENEKIISCYLFWNSALQSFCFEQNLVQGFKKDYGYILDKPNKEQSLIIKKIVENYFNGIKPTNLDFKFFNFNLDRDAETSVIEYLTPKIKILKRF